LGDWAREELLVAQDRAAKEPAFRLIPILLPGVPDPFEHIVPVSGQLSAKIVGDNQQNIIRRTRGRRRRNNLRAKGAGALNGTTQGAEHSAANT